MPPLGLLPSCAPPCTRFEGLTPHEGGQVCASPMPDGSTMCTGPLRAYVPALDDGCSEGAYRCTVSSSGDGASPSTATRTVAQTHYENFLRWLPAQRGLPQPLRGASPHEPSPALKLPPPPAPSPPPPSPPPKLTFVRHPGANCFGFWNGVSHGARVELEEDNRAAPGMDSIEKCERGCLQIGDRCEGFVWHGARRECWRKGGLHLPDCTADMEWDLFRLETPGPPAPPSPPPPPPHPPGSTAAIIDARFRNGRPSNDLREAGILIHQFDNLEDWAAGRGFAPCHSGWCDGQYDHASFSIINPGSPQTFNGNGGVILSPHTQIECSYAADGGTQSQSIGSACSLDRAFPPDRLADMLRYHAGNGGYNEVVVANSEWDKLPYSVEAIFYVNDDTQARDAHSAFVREYNTPNLPFLRYTGSGFVDG